MRANRMHRQGLDRHPKKIGIFDIRIRITQKMVCYSTENYRNKGYARFGGRLTFKMGRTGREGQPDA